MASFQFKLEPLLRYRRHRRDLCRQMLAEILADEHRLILQRSRLDRARAEQLEEMKELARSARLDIDRTAARRYHAGYLLAETRQLERSRELIQQQIDLCRRALVLADRDVKVLERLKERQYAEFAERAARRAQLELEETWLLTHWREAS